MPKNKVKTKTKKVAARKKTVSAIVRKPGTADVGLLTKLMANLKGQASKKSKPTLSSILSDIGGYAGDVIPRMIWGRGAYSMSKNSMFDVNTQTQVPMMHSNSESVTFRHREYIADVSSSTGFAVTTYAVNPGLSATFPYLSGIAQNFQEYEFKGLVFEFKSTSADALNSTNTALGTVMMAAQYRADASTFINKEQLLNEMWSSDSKPSCSFVLPVECQPAENPLSIQYTRAAAVPSGQDAKLYDLAKVSIATYGSQAVCDIGELWASYEVVLRKPQLSQSLDLYGLGFHYSFTGCSGAVPLGTKTLIVDSIGVSIAANIITLPVQLEGYFMVYWTSYGTGVTSVNTNITYTNATAVAGFAANSNNTYVFSPQNGVGSSVQWTYTEFFKVLDNTKAATMIFGVGGTLPTAATSDVVLLQIPFGFS